MSLFYTFVYRPILVPLTLALKPMRKQEVPSVSIHAFFLFGQKLLIHIYTILCGARADGFYLKGLDGFSDWNFLKRWICEYFGGSRALHVLPIWSMDLIITCFV